MTGLAGKKYEILNTGERESSGLHRIRALRDFGNVAKGDVGGFIHDESNLSHEGDCWIAEEASVSSQARVQDNAVVRGSAMISGRTIVADNVEISGHVIFGEDVRLGGKLRITAPPLHPGTPRAPTPDFS